MTLTIGPSAPPTLPGLSPLDGTAPVKGVRDVASGVLGDQAGIRRHAEGVLLGGHTEAPELPPVNRLGSGAVNSAIATLGGLSLSGGLNMQAIARAVYDDARESRAAVRTDRQVARDAAMQADQAAADDVRSSAKFTEIATIVSSSLSMLGAMVSLGDSISTLHMLTAPPSTSEVPEPDAELGDVEMQDMSTPGTPEASSGESSLGEAEPKATSKAADKTVDDLEKPPEKPTSGAAKKPTYKELYDKMDSAHQTQFLQSKSGLADSVSKILDGIGKLAAAPLNAAAADYDAKKLEQQAESTKQQSKADDDSDFVRSYTDLASSVLDKLASMQEAQSQANQSIIANTKA